MRSRINEVIIAFNVIGRMCSAKAYNSLDILACRNSSFRCYDCTIKNICTPELSDIMLEVVKIKNVVKIISNDI